MAGGIVERGDILRLKINWCIIGHGAEISTASSVVQWIGLSFASNSVAIANPALEQEMAFPASLPALFFCNPGILTDEEVLGETNPLFTICLCSLISYLRVKETG